MRDETWHDDGFSVVKGTCWRGRSWKSGVEKWQGGPAAQPWKKMGHSGASSGRPTLRACPRLAFVGEQRKPRAGTESHGPLFGPAVPSLTPAAHWLFLLWNVPAPRILLGNRGSSYPLSSLSSPICVWVCLGVGREIAYVCPESSGWN